MSRRRNRDSGGGCRCCMSCLVAIIIVIVLLVTAVVVVLNMTPNKLGFGDTKIINNKSFNEYGLGDIKFIDIIKEFWNMRDVNEEDVVTNGYSEEEESTVAQTALDNSSFTGDDYSTLATTDVVYDKQYVIEYNDTTIAYIFNKIISDGVELNDNLSDLKKFQIEVREITIYTNSDNTYSIRVVVKFNTAAILSQADAGPALNILPENVYLVYNAPVTANAEGALEIGEGVFTVNGDETTPIFTGLFNIINEFYPMEELANKVADGVETVVGHLGKIGTAEKNANNEAVESTIVLGSSGISEHKITVITHIESAGE